MTNNNQKMWIGIIIGIVAIAIIVVAYIFSRHTPTYSTETVARRNITQIVRTTGSIVPEDISSLSFSAQGKIQDVRVHAGDIVHKGDTLAVLDTSTIQAQLDGALADEAAAQAQLNKLQSGTRPETLAIYTQGYFSASSALIVAMNNSYLQTADAINNKADTLFTNGNSVNPIIAIRTQSSTEQLNINQELVAINDKLTQWKNALTNLTTSNNSTSSLETALTITNNTLTSVQTFLTDLGTIANNLSVGNSGLPQSTINADMAIVNGASQEVTGASNSFTTAHSAWSAARDNLALQNAGAQSQDIASQSAVLAKAEAEVEGYESALSQSRITAPFDGTITEVNMKIGEVVVPGLSANEDIGIIGTSVYNIETYVPENSIGSMNIGNPATITFDAYGSGVVFPATVYLVSPAETVINGVNSYKVTLRFDQSDSRIRSGLTVNALITTATSTNTLAVPTRGIITNGNQKFILVKNSKGVFSEHPITTGIAGSDDYTEVLSGVNEGDIVASFGTENY